MVIRHRDFIHDYEARDPGREEQGLRNAVIGFKPPPVPGHYNATLGQRLAVSSRRNSTLSKANIKARVTLAKVWEDKPDGQA